jgi:hypothetical protein
VDAERCELLDNDAHLLSGDVAQDHVTCRLDCGSRKVNQVRHSVEAAKETKDILDEVRRHDQTECRHAPTLCTPQAAQLQPTHAVLGAPPVFVSRYVQTHVRVYRGSDAVEVELWEHPRATRQQLRVAERLAVLGRLPAEPDVSTPRVRARTSV